MFTEFFFLLRTRGLPVSLDEWLTFLSGMKKGLHGFTLGGLYTLARCTLVKSETDFDAFDMAFMEFFEGALPADGERELPPELLEWLEGPALGNLDDLGFAKSLLQDPDIDMEEMLRRFQELLDSQTEEHNGGSKWIGRGGRSQYGNSGSQLGGIRVGGRSQNRSAFMVASERRYRDFRNDETIGLRQFQMALRKLRELTDQTNAAETELDVDATVRETGDAAGLLKVVYRRPRKNNIRLMLLMDSGGSMDAHMQTCATLFQAARQSNFFRDVKVFYFHNCIYDDLFVEPTLTQAPVAIDDVLRATDPEYRVIFVGDAMMATAELNRKLYNWNRGTYAQATGMQRLLQVKARYPHVIWLNPEDMDHWGSYWRQTCEQIGQVIDMYRLTVDGLEAGVRRLLTSR